MDVARDEQEVLVVTENGFGKRTSVDEYRKTSRGAKGVQTIKFSEKRGGLAAALVVRQHQELVFISQEGMVQRTGVRGIRRRAAPAQGVTVMNSREDDHVSAVALVVESDSSTAAVVESDAALADGPIDLSADSGDVASRTSRPRRPPKKIRDPSRRCYFWITRERRWSVSQVTVFAGPWRWPAARSVGLDPIQRIHHRATLVNDAGCGPPGGQHQSVTSRKSSQVARGAPSRAPLVRRPLRQPRRRRTAGAPRRARPERRGVGQARGEVHAHRDVPVGMAAGVGQHGARRGDAVVHGEVHAQVGEVDGDRPGAARRPVDDPAEPAVLPERVARVRVAMDEALGQVGLGAPGHGDRELPDAALPGPVRTPSVAGSW